MKKPYDIIVEHGIIEDIDFLVRKDVVSAIIEAMEEYAESVRVSRNIMCGFDLDDMRDAWESSKNNPKTFDEWIEKRNRI